MIKLEASSCLIQAVAGEILRNRAAVKHADRTLATPELVVLPTVRLGTALIAALAQQSPNGGIIAPTVFTLDDFIRHSVKKMEGDAARKLLTVETWAADRLELLIEAFLKNEKWKLLNSGHAHEVAHLFSELEKNALEDHAFANLRRVVSEDVYRTDENLGMIGARLAELEALYERLGQALQKSNALSKNLWNQKATRLLLNDWNENRVVPWTKLIIGGFTSATPMEMDLFKLLEGYSKTGDGRHAVTIIMHESPPIFAKTSPLKEMLQQIGDLSPQASSHRGAHPKTRIVVPMSGVADEVAYAVDLARKAVEQGIPASRVSIVATAEDIYGKLLRTALSDKSAPGVRPNIAVPIALRDTPAGVWLRLLTNVLDPEVDAESVLDFVTHPLSSTAKIRLELTQLLCSERIIRPQELKDFCAVQVQDQGPHAAVSAIVIELFEKLAPFRDSFIKNSPASADSWRQHLEQITECFLAPKSTATDVIGRDSVNESINSAIANYIKSLVAIDSHYPIKMTGIDFLRSIDRHLLSAKVRSVGDPLAGLQVLGLTEARHMPFSLMIILGCTEGNFPRSVPRDSLVDQYLQGRIGLPGWRQLESMEDTTFGLLNERLPNIVMTYPKTDGDSPSVRSRFLDRLVNEGKAVEIVPEQSTRFLGGYAKNHDLVLEVTEPYRSASLGISRSLVSSAASTSISASSLSQLLACPYAFALQKMGVRDQVFHRDDDRRSEGEWMHEVLEAFFSGKKGQGAKARRIAPDLPSAISASDFDSWAMQRIMDIAKLLAPASIQKTALWLRLETFSFPRFITHVRKIWTKAGQIHPAMGWKELRLKTNSSLQSGDPQPTSTSGQAPRIFALIHPPTGYQNDTEGGPLPASGAIDSVDFCESVVLLTDYKRSGTPTGTEVDQGFAPQIPFYVHALLSAIEPVDLGKTIKLENVVAGFWSILDGEFILAGSGSESAFAEAKRLGFINASARTPRNLGDSITAFNRNWKWRTDEIVATNQYAPDESACGYCQLATSCRRNDPQLKIPFKQNRRLDRYQAELGDKKK